MATLGGISKGRRDHVLTFVSEGAVLVATVIVYKLVATRLGEEAFEHYTVVRRTVSFLQMIGLCGLAVGLVRAVALSHAPGRRVGLLRASLRRVGGLGAVFLLIALLLPGAVAVVFFDTAELAVLSLPIAMLTLGLLAHNLIYGYLRGTERMALANLLQVLNMALVPNIAVLLLPDLVQALWATGGAWLMLSGAFLLRSCWEAPPEKDAADDARMLRYGLLRLPGDVVFAGLLTLPVYLVNHVQGLSVGAQLAFGITLVNVAGAAYSPLSLILLPSAAGLLARKEWSALEVRIGRVMRFSALSALVLVAGFEAVATPFLRLYLGAVGEGMEAMCRLVFAGALFFGVFVSLRSVLDAYYTAPRNTFNLVWSMLTMAVLAVVYIAFVPTLWMAALLVLLPLAVLMLLTWRDVQWVREDLRARTRSGPGTLHVLELGGSKVPRNLAPSTTWTIASAVDPRAGWWRTLRSVRRAEHQHRPDLVLVRGSGRLAWAALLVARRPLALLMPDARPGFGVRTAAWMAGLVVFPTEPAAAASGVPSRSVRVIASGAEGEAELLRSLRALHDPADQ